MSTWIPLLSALASLTVILVQWWLANSPARKLRKARDENVEIHNEIASGDVHAVRSRIRRLRAEAGSGVR